MLNRIRDLRPDIVKFDAQWIVKLMDSGPGVALLGAMVDRFAARGIVTVFEGIEEGWQLDVAERAGAAMVQGYALARPEIVPHGFHLFRIGELPEAAPPSPDERAAERHMVRAETAKSVQVRRSGRTFGRRAGATP